MALDEHNHNASPFEPTRWSLVLRASDEEHPEGSAAMSELCETYYQPVLRFIRRVVRKQDQAGDLTQEFFNQLLSKRNLNPDPNRGRFRSYLLGAVKHFLADQRKESGRLKKNSGRQDESLDSPEFNEEMDSALANEGESDTCFDREWALNLMAKGLETLTNEYLVNGKSNQFEALKPWLAGTVIEISQAETAKKLGWSESAVKVAIHRLRKRFREIIRQEIAQTVSEKADVDHELSYLVEVLSENPR